MSLRARLLIALGYLVALVIVAFAVPLGANLRDRVGDEVRATARTQADVLAAGVAGMIETRDRDRIGRLAESVGAAARARVVVVDRRGRVLADTADPDAIGVDFSSRPELAAALAEERFQDSRRSDTLDQEILATATPVFDAGRVVGAVRLTQSVDAVQDAVRRTVLGIAAVGLAVLLAALVAAFLLARGITRPIERLGAAARPDRVGRPRRPRRGRGQPRAALAGALVQPDDRAAGPRAAGADGVRRGRVAPVADAADRAAAADRGGARDARPRRCAARISTPASSELDRMSHTIDDLLVLSRTGEREGAGEAVDLADAVADARRRWGRAAAAREIALSAEHGGAAQRLGLARRPRPRRRRGGRERDPLHAAGGHVIVRADGAAIEVLDDGPGARARRGGARSSRASIAGRPAAGARPAPGSACRSPAS